MQIKSLDSIPPNLLKFKNKNGTSLQVEGLNSTELVQDKSKWQQQRNYAWQLLNV